MPIALYTNTSFYNDIAEELRLFTDAAVVCAETPDAADVTVLLDGWTARAQATLAPGRADYSYTHPAVTGSLLVVKRYEKRCVKIAAFRMMQKLYNTATPWGSLTGIRPTRLYRELLQEGVEAADAMMLDEFDVSPDKLRLAKTITAVQQPIFATQTPKDVDVYIGVPYCRTRCLYCSFGSEVRGAKTDMCAYLDALKQDIAYGAAIVRDAGYTLRSVYMGGGTPTVLTAAELEDVLAFALDAYGGYGQEFTVEAGRPDTIDEEKLALLKRLGVGRISINPQSMNADTLERIGRSHSPESIPAIFAISREIGFTNINMDVIAGLPGEDDAAMRRTLDAIMEMEPDNLTVHTLAIKRSSRLKQCLEQYPLPDAATAESMTRMGAQAAEKMGMRPYYMYRQKYMRGNLENVGYAVPGKECIYNVDMMEETTSIMAHGAGAMTKRIFGGEHRVERIPNPKDVPTYIQKLAWLEKEKRKLFMQE
ncbi:MAG: coproporphyrinogen dehydrogenase HemZ [Clostridia bacterium]|nr:coproporphyrinogen dehydrogenase HemZ [Clostridia bacterium]